MVKTLVGGVEHQFYFPFHIWDNPNHIDELIFFRGVGLPPIRSLLTIINHISTIY